MQKRKGKHLQQIKKTGYHLFSVGWVWGKEPHSEKRISEKEACSILNGGGIFFGTVSISTLTTRDRSITW